MEAEPTEQQALRAAGKAVAYGHMPGSCPGRFEKEGQGDADVLAVGQNHSVGVSAAKGDQGLSSRSAKHPPHQPPGGTALDGAVIDDIGCERPLQLEEVLARPL